MAYAFESQLVIDPVSGDKAASASVTVYDANDTANSAPLALTDLNGNPLSNPLTSTHDAFIPPFMAETYKVKLVGGGLTVVAWSGEGLKDEAKAAKDYVLGIGIGETTTAPPGAPASVTLDKATGKFSFDIPTGDPGPAGRDGSNVLPTDNAVAQAVSDPASATRGALNGTYAGLVSPDLTGNPRVGGVSISTVSGAVNVLSYGAKADLRTPADLSMTAGSATITSPASYAFTSADVGKYVKVAGAGSAGGALITTIAAVTSSTTATLATNAVTTVANAQGYIGTNNTASIQAAINALPNGGSIVIPQGRYLVAGNITVTVPLTVRGSVASHTTSTSGTYLGSPSAGTSMFTCSSDNVRFDNIAFTNLGTFAEVQAAASAMAIDFTSGTNCRVSDCRFNGWYKALWFRNCALWAVEKNSFTSSVKYHIHIQNVTTPDAGDQFLERNYFFSNASGNYTVDAVVRYESGGGMKAVGNKIIGGAYGFDLAVADGVATSILLLSANSIEAVSTGHIRLGQLGTTGTYRQIAITGNQFSGQNINSNYYMQFGAGISEVTVNGNVMYGPAGVARYINITGGSRYNIDGNSFNDGLVGININTGGLDVRVGDGNKFRGIIDPVIDGGAYSMTARDSIIHEYTRTVPGLGTGSYTAVVQIGFGTPGACEVEFSVYGRLTTGGNITGVGLRVQRFLVQATAGAAPSVTAMGADTQVGALNVQFDTTTVVGSVRIGLKRDPADGADSFSGMYRVKVSGAQNRVSILTNA